MNWSMGAPKEPWQPTNFPLPLLKDMPLNVPQKRINRKKIAARIRANFDAAAKRLKQNAPQPPR